MSMSDSAREITWAGGTHTFDLNSRRGSWMLALRPFPGQFGDTPAACLKRFEDSVYSPNDIENVIRIGLMGGGMSEADADSMIAQYVRNQPLAPNAMLAHALLTALFVGNEEAA